MLRVVSNDPVSVPPDERFEQLCMHAEGLLRVVSNDPVSVPSDERFEQLCMHAEGCK